jgi:lactate dehydrogenase-like 2-hydroxyacid dehydrogenase
MKISVLFPKNEFSQQHQKTLAQLGSIVYSKDRQTMPVKQIIDLVKGSDILAIDPDIFGGFEKAKDRVTAVMDSLPNLKGLALSSTFYGWIDLKYCQKRKIPVCNIPGYSRESVAEHALALLLCLAKRIIVTDRKTREGKFKLEMGFELKGKTLGIIGLGSIGSRVAELAQGISMKVIAYNRSPRRQKGVKMKSLNQVLRQSDAISLNVIDSSETEHMISTKQFNQMKDGVIIVNTVGREIVDEKAMAKAIQTGKVYGYAYEDKNLNKPPLAKLENAIGIKGFGWYTKEALDNLMQIWVDNIIAIVKNRPQNVVS